MILAIFVYILTMRSSILAGTVAWEQVIGKLTRLLIDEVSRMISPDLDF